MVDPSILLVIAMTPPKTPPCPKCHLTDRAEPEEQTGSSASWFVCDRCGIRFTIPPARR
jgi:hypothetical protein